MERTATRLLTAALILAMAGLAGCKDEVNYVDGSKWDIPSGVPDGTSFPEYDGHAQPDMGPVGKDAPGLGAKALAFVDSHGDDNVPCTGTDHCKIFVSFAEKRSLRVLYTEDGVPTEGRTVYFKLVDDPNGLGWISAAAGSTDADGVATIETKPGKTELGQFAVQAYVNDPATPPLTFEIVIDPKKVPPLTVIGKYKGTSTVNAYTVRLYKQAEGLPSCVDLEWLYEDGQAVIASPLTVITKSVKFSELPGLQDEGVQRYTILAYSENAQGAVIAWGCVDSEKAEVKAGFSTTVEVEITDRPPIYAGTYTVTSHFDFITALPESIQPWIYMILDILESPVGGLLKVMCTFGGEVPVLEDACDLIFQDPDAPSIDQLTWQGQIIVDVLNTILVAVAADSVWGDVLKGGKDISQILTDFEVHGTISFLEEPTDGVWVKGQTAETWDGITVKWTLDKECNPAVDPNCGVTNIWFSAIQAGDPVVGTFDAHVDDFWWLNIDHHPLNVKYGALINYILQKVVLPLIAGDGSDGGPVVDSYYKLFGMLLGGKDCLVPGQMGCCAKFANDIAASGGQTFVDIVESACDALVGLGADLIEQQLMSLDLSTGDVFQIGTAEACRFHDANNDRIVDAFGAEQDPGYWDVKLGLLGAQTSMSGWFYGTRAN